MDDGLPQLGGVLPDWAGAACAGADPEAWFPEEGLHPRSHPGRMVLAACAACPVRRPCLDFALAHPDLEGVWAGTTPRMRRRLRRERDRARAVA